MESEKSEGEVKIIEVKILDDEQQNALNSEYVEGNVNINEKHENRIDEEQDNVESENSEDSNDNLEEEEQEAIYSDINKDENVDIYREQEQEASREEEQSNMDKGNKL